MQLIVEDIIAILKTKVSEKDSNNLEDFLLSKLDELKTVCNKI
jgi:hypothetical protein